MKAYFSVTLIFLCSLFSQNLLFSQEEDDDCGVEEYIPAAYIDFLNELEANSGNLSATLNEGFTYFIPINVVVLDVPDEGQDLTMLASKERALDAVAYINEQINPVMRFYLCNYEIHFDYPDAGISPFSPTSDFMETGIPLFENPDVVNVYVFDASFSSNGTYPAYDDGHGAVFLSNVISAKVFTHEMGHYFGLLHTHTSTVNASIVEGQGNILITPSNSWHPTANLLTCTCCDCVSLENGVLTCFPECEQEVVCDCNAYNSGDFIADTPPDPSDDFCTSNPNEGCPSDACEVIDNQGVTWTYYPDRKNIMSYYSCRAGFSALQKDRMLQTLLVYPTRAHLINPEPTCESFVSGKVLLPRYDNSTGSYYFDPHPSIDLDIFNENNNLLCEETTDITGRYLLESCYAITPEEVTVIPEGNSDSHTEGVSTQDIIKIQKHVLNIETLPLPYSQIAADVNNSGSITTLDIIRVRKLVLGLINEFPEGKWRFLPTYSFHPQWGFKTLFYTDPFNVIWTYDTYDNGIEMRSYDYDTPPVYFDKADIDMTNNPDVVLENTWSFYAVKVGDANLSITPQPFEGLLEEEENRLEYKFSDEGNCVEKNDKFLIRAKMTSSQPVMGYQFALEWGLDFLNISGLESGNVSPFSFEMFNITELTSGKLRTSWTDIQGGVLQEDQEHHLFQLQAESNQDFCGVEDILNIINNNTPLVAEFYDLDGEVIDEVFLSFEIIPIERIHKVESIFPNPVSGQISIDYKLGEQGTVQLKIFDQFGNELTDQFSMPSGEHSYTFPSSSSLQNGVLYYEVILGNEVYLGNLIKL